MKNNNKASANSDSIPDKIDYLGEEYDIEIIKKEAPDEIVCNRRKIIVSSGFEEIIYFITYHFILLVGGATIFFWGDWIKAISAYALILSMWGVEYMAYKIKCNNYKYRDAKSFPHIKVSYKDSVITTMTPKAYIGKIDLDVIDYPVPVLPIKIKLIGHVYMFSADRFLEALSNAIKSKEEREAKKS